MVYQHLRREYSPFPLHAYFKKQARQGLYVLYRRVERYYRHLLSYRPHFEGKPGGGVDRCSALLSAPQSSVVRAYADGSFENTQD